MKKFIEEYSDEAQEAFAAHKKAGAAAVAALDKYFACPVGESEAAWKEWRKAEEEAERAYLRAVELEHKEDKEK